MERLTISNNGVAWYKSDLLLLEPCELSYSQVGKVLRSLAAYEDTGLTPEEVKALVKADTEGRVLHYVPGDTVYDRYGMAWTVTSSEIHKFGDGPLRYLYRCGHPGTDDYCALYSDEIQPPPEVGL